MSAWNDNGKTGLINETAPELLYRTDFFPGLGWMLTKGEIPDRISASCSTLLVIHFRLLPPPELWTELMVKWPRSYWDDWMREPAQRKGKGGVYKEEFALITTKRTSLTILKNEGDKFYLLKE